MDKEKFSLSIDLRDHENWIIEKISILEWFHIIIDSRWSTTHSQFYQIKKSKGNIRVFGKEDVRLSKFVVTKIEQIDRKFSQGNIPFHLRVELQVIVCERS